MVGPLEILVKTSTQLFYSSLDAGRIPAALQASIVTLVHKSGDTKSCGSYKSADMASILLKTLEWVLRNGTVKQHGFWREHSCLINCISILDEVKGRRVC